MAFTSFISEHSLAPVSQACFLHLPSQSYSCSQWTIGKMDSYHMWPHFISLSLRPYASNLLDHGTEECRESIQLVQININPHSDNSHQEPKFIQTKNLLSLPSNLTLQTPIYLLSTCYCSNNSVNRSASWDPESKSQAKLAGCSYKPYLGKCLL